MQGQEIWSSEAIPSSHETELRRGGTYTILSTSYLCSTRFLLTSHTWWLFLQHQWICHIQLLPLFTKEAETMSMFSKLLPEPKQLLDHCEFTKIDNSCVIVSFFRQVVTKEILFFFRSNQRYVHHLCTKQQIIHLNHPNLFTAIGRNTCLCRPSPSFE